VLNQPGDPLDRPAALDLRPGPQRRGLTATALHPIEMEDIGLAAAALPEPAGRWCGALGSIVATTVALPGFSDRLELHGSEGSLVLVQGEGRLEWHLRGQEPARRGGQQPGQPWLPGPGRDPRQAATSRSSRTSTAAIREGRPPLSTGARDAPALELVEAIYRSSRTGRAVELPL